MEKAKQRQNKNLVAGVFIGLVKILGLIF